eukprot:1158484-Pelagomonas_calceolata.AAC.10
MSKSIDTAAVVGKAAAAAAGASATVASSHSMASLPPLPTLMCRAWPAAGLPPLQGLPAAWGQLVLLQQRERRVLVKGWVDMEEQHSGGATLERELEVCGSHVHMPVLK